MEDFDVAPNGSLVAVGFSKSDGRRAQFIAILPLSGHPRVIQTTPYWPELVSVAPDGSIWTVGVESTYNSEGREIGTDPRAAALRHFSASGLLIGGRVAEEKAPRGSTVSGFLVANAHGVAWYGPTYGNAQYYMEAPADLTNFARYSGISVPADPYAEPQTEIVEGAENATGFAVTDSGKIYLSTSTRGANSQSTYSLYSFEQTSKTWRRLDMPANIIRRLLGSRGESLVFRSKGVNPQVLKIFDFSGSTGSK